MTQRGTSWPIPPPLKLLAKLPWRDQGVTCNDEQWQQFKQKIEPYIGSDGRWALPKQTLGSRIQALTLPNRTANTVRNYFGAQNPLAKDYVDLIQGACLTVAWFETAPELIRTEAIYQLINQLPGVERGKLRGWLGRRQVPIVGQRMALPGIVTELHPALTDWLNQVTNLPFAPRTGLVGSAVEHQTQLSLICEQDEVHTAFCAVVIETVQTPDHLSTLTQTLATIDQGNPTKPILLLLTILTVFPELQQFLDQCGHAVRVVLFSTDMSLVAGLGVAMDNLVVLSMSPVGQSQTVMPTLPPTPMTLGTPPMAAPSSTTTSAKPTPHEWIKIRVRELQAQSAVPYLELPRSTIDVPLALPKLVITGVYGRGKRTLLRNLVAAINAQPNRAALVIDCRDNRLHLLFADISSLLVYLLKPEIDPTVDPDGIAEAVTQMLGNGALVPAFIHAESLPKGTATTLAASLAGSAKRFYLTTRDANSIAKIAPAHRLEPLANIEQLALVASLRPELDREAIAALLAAAPSWMTETLLGLAVVLANPDKSKPALVIAYATHCIHQEGFTAHGTTLTKLACLLADFVQLKGNIDNKHCDSWEAFVSSAGLDLVADERSAQLARLNQCGIVTGTDGKITFTHPDLEMMFAAYGWLTLPDRLQPSLERAAQWLSQMSAWEISDSMRAHLIDALPLPERADSLHAEHLLPVMDFLIATPEATLRQCQQLGQRLEKLAAALNTWKASPTPLPRAGQFETYFSKIDQAARMDDYAAWVEAHPLLLEYRQEQRRLADRAKALRLIESCRDEIGTLCQRVIGDELTPLSSNANYKTYRDKIREVCQSFAAHHDDADIKKDFGTLLNQFWKEWPTVILELLAIDDVAVLDTALTLYRRERVGSARDFAEGRTLPLNELRYRRLPALVMDRLRVESVTPTSRLNIQQDAAAKLLKELETWAQP